MSSLRELQRAFKAALLDGGAQAILGSIREGGGLSAAQRLQVHRNTATLLLAEALTANVPATARMVDERFFAYAAAGFLRRHPPRQPRLAEYGRELPEFLAAFEPAAGLPWLADLARLERIMLDCQEAPEVRALVAEDLSDLTPDHIAELRLPWRPAAGLLASPWPVDALRDYALHGGEGRAPSLQDGPVRLLIRRTADGVAARRLGADEYALLDRIGSGLSLAEALDGLATEPAPILARAIADGVFSAPLAKP